MDHAQSCIAVLHRIHDDPYCKQVVYLIQRLVLVHHLLINTEEMLHSSVHLGLDMGVLHMMRNFCHDLLYKLFPLGLSLIQIFHQLEIHFRLIIFQREIIQLRLNLGDSKSLSDRSVNIHRLSGFFLLFCRNHKLQRSHIVQAVCQLDNDHTDIFCHGEKHLAQIFCLYFQLIFRIRQLTQLGDPVYQKCDFFSKFSCDILHCHLSIFHRIMEHPCHDRLFIHLQISQNDPHPERMDDIGLSGLSHLLLVSLSGKLISFLDQRNIRRRMIFSHPCNQCVI